jgi:hypothetical protein
MSTTPESDPSSQSTAVGRGSDERKQAVDPAQNPAPSSPEPDEEALRKGEETLERVKPY